MATTTLPSVQLRDIPVSEEVGDGGEGAVFDLADGRKGLDGRPLVLKRYQRPPDPTRAAHLAQLVALRGQLRLGADAFAWPEVLVRDGEHAVGVLMPRAPAPFWAEVTLRSGALRRRLREAQYLLFPAAKLQAIGIDFAPLAARLEVLAALVVAVGHLHHLGLVYGDLSARNVTYATGGPVGVFLLDCDGIATIGSSYVVDSPDWDDPAAPEVASTAADVYKLGLLAARMLAISPTVREVPTGGRTPDQLVAVLKAAVDPDPSARPTTDELAAAVLRMAPGPPAPDGATLPVWGLRPGSGELVLVPTAGRSVDGASPAGADEGARSRGRGLFRRGRQ